MGHSDLLMDGVNLMLIGMGTVFVFLSLLVISVTMMSKLAHRLAPIQPAAPAAATLRPGEVPHDHIAAITAAVRRYRHDHHR